MSETDARPVSVGNLSAVLGALSSKVLYDGPKASPVTLSDDPANYEFVIIMIQPGNSSTLSYTYGNQFSVRFPLNTYDPGYSASSSRSYKFYSLNGRQLSAFVGMGEENDPCIIKVVGIK